MLLRLLLLFTIVPAVELFLLLQIGSLLGPTTTFLLILITGLVGASLAKREGLGVLLNLRDEMTRGMPQGSRLMEGALVLAGGLLLVTPGVFTDLAGFLLILPPSRRLIARRATAALSERLDVRTVGFDVPPGAGPQAHGTGPHGPPPYEAPRPHQGAPFGPRPQPTPFTNPFDDLP